MINKHTKSLKIFLNLESMDIIFGLAYINWQLYHFYSVKHFENNFKIRENSNKNVFSNTK